MRIPLNFEDIPLGAFDTISLVNSVGLEAFLRQQQTLDAAGMRGQTAKIDATSERNAEILRAHRTSLNTISVEVRSLEQWIDDAAIYGNSNYFSPHDANQLGHFARVCSFVKRQGVSIHKGKISAPEEWVLACWIMKCWAFSLQIHLHNAAGAADDYEASLFSDSCSSIIRHAESLLFSIRDSDSAFPPSRVPTYCVDFLREIFNRGCYSYDQSEYSDDEIQEILRGLLDSKGAEQTNPNVAAQAPSELAESKLNKTDKVSPVFNGALNRSFCARILGEWRSNNNLSLNDVAKIAGVSKTEIHRIEHEVSKLERSLEILTAIGFEFDEVNVRPPSVPDEP